MTTELIASILDETSTAQTKHLLLKMIPCEDVPEVLDVLEEHGWKLKTMTPWGLDFANLLIRRCA